MKNIFKIFFTLLIILFGFLIMNRYINQNTTENNTTKNITQREIKMKTPIAEKIPFSFVKHGKEIIDQYHWLKDKDWPHIKNEKIINYLKEENKYYEYFFSDLNEVKEKIFEELKGRIKLEDQSLYIRKDDYYYYTRTLADKDYPVYCRRYGSQEGKEEILLDINELAKGKTFIDIGDVAFSPDHRFMAYSVNFDGDEKYIIKIYDLIEKRYLADEINNSSGSITWHKLLKGFFYSSLNKEYRADKVFFHNLGESEDKLIYKEENPAFRVATYASSSKEYIFLVSRGSNSKEIYFISKDDKNMSLNLLVKRTQELLYMVDHRDNYFYIQTNDKLAGVSGRDNSNIQKSNNFRLMKAHVDNFSIENWQEYIAEDKEQYLDSFDLTKNYLILNYKFNALPLIKVRDLDDNEKEVSFPDTAFVASAYSTNFELDDIRISYSSLARPSSTYAYDFIKNHISLLKQQEIPSGFDPNQYNVERIFADNEGVSVPITLIYKKSLFNKDSKNPLYLYGYGSYGISVEPSFRTSIFSLVDRGFIFAIAHIRGGDELGFEWYNQARFLNKKRTFSDFIAVTEKLIAEKYTKSGNICISGGSAGGLLVGNVVNTRPELFKAVIAHVPFVDVLNTMLDSSLPLTPGEFKEWGNPEEEQYFNYILSYSPYDNIKRQKYPAMLVTGGIADPRVQYWEPAKWVAKLREFKQDDNIIILKTNMDMGHSGPSGRFDAIRERAEEIVFTLKIFNLLEDLI